MTTPDQPQFDLSGARIMVVDDVLTNRKVLCQMLSGAGYDVFSVPDGETALEAVSTDLPDVILLDVTMPGIDGYEVCRRLKQNERTRSIPVIFITARNEIRSLLEGFHVGGVDYLTKPIQTEEVLVRVETHLKLKRLTQSLMAKNEELQQEVIRRKQAEESAERASEAKSQFISFVSHEMRTPLNAIKGFSEMLIEDATQPATSETVEDLQRIHKASGYLIGLINNLLDLSKIEAGKMPLVLEEFDLAALVNELAGDVRPLAQANGNKLEVIVGEVAGTIRADVTKTKEVLLNLLSNACKFTNQGTISLRLRQQDTPPKRCWLIEVADTGIGMTEEEMQRLFNPYSQANASTSKRYGGTGLGLAISKKFCQLIGGDVAVQSQPGQGTTFTVTLPAMGPSVDDGSLPTA